MDQKIKHIENSQPLIGPIDCACVIHGSAYDWTYVERLFNMLTRNISFGIRFHVYTEPERPVPDHMIKHSLIDWGISGPKQSWWYKMQLFDTSHHAGPLLYFDLDTVVVANIDWICQHSSRYFWSIQDFKYLWRPNHQGINSSIMWWDTRCFDYLYKNFKEKNLPIIMKHYHGDQDYLSREIEPAKLRFLPQERIKSWRWQCLNGGYNFKKRVYTEPNSGTRISADISVLVFHGMPKPADLKDPVIVEHWR